MFYSICPMEEFNFSSSIFVNLFDIVLALYFIWFIKKPIDFLNQGFQVQLYSMINVMEDWEN
ncbi:Hypothetical protein I595_486 [Croceitalea dokdonensis DOKDO 023]|uniref:Uncharacterized protein n=1 Tax=Croceitalea dokdonensis DOKDO 023 TaxID=1300341 RepID=A0A0P7AZ91_9FLAO|nr:Hypothetical protein I595_486 [Croceitalea dokdonensis DOKDO 023]